MCIYFTRTLLFDKCNSYDFFILPPLFNKFLPPVVFYSPTESYFLADFCAYRVSKCNLGQIGFGSNNSSASTQGTDVN